MVRLFYFQFRHALSARQTGGLMRSKETRGYTIKPTWGSRRQSGRRPCGRRISRSGGVQPRPLHAANMRPVRKESHHGSPLLGLVRRESGGRRTRGPYIAATPAARPITESAAPTAGQAGSGTRTSGGFACASTTATLATTQSRAAGVSWWWELGSAETPPAYAGGSGWIAL